VILESLDFDVHLAGLMPRPWVNLTRYHELFSLVVFLIGFAAVSSLRGVE
jgi:hypothetical protein